MFKTRINKIRNKDISNPKKEIIFIYEKNGNFSIKKEDIISRKANKKATPTTKK